MARMRLVSGIALIFCLWLTSVTGVSAQTAPNAGYNVPSGSSGSSATGAVIRSSAPSATNSAKGSASGNSQKQVTKLPDLAITATRIPQSVGKIGTTITVVHDKQIQDQKIQQVSDALREVPGVIVNQSGGPGTITSVFIRGASSSQSLTMIDGVEVNSPTAGDYDFSNLTTDNLSQIEVLRGAGGSLYGSSAIGGVVNVLTQEGTGAPRFSLLADGGNWETSRTIGSAIGSIGKLNYSSAISYFVTNGYEPINNSYDNLSGVWRADYHLTDNTTLRGFARYTRACVGLPEFSNETLGAPKDPNANQRDEFMLFKGEIDSQVTEKLLVRAFGSFVRDQDQVNKYPSFKNNYFESDNTPGEIRGANGEAVYTWTEGFPTLVGFDFKDLWAREYGSFIDYLPPPPPVHLSVSNSIFSPTQEQYAGYLQQQGSFLHDYLLVTGGFRVDGNSQFGEEVSPSWAVAIPLQKYGVTLRANYAEGFEAPTFNDLYFPGFGNPNLPATTSSEYDGGIEKRFGEWGSFTATYFTRRIHNLITSAPCRTCTSGFEAIAVGRNDTQGVELSPSTYPIRGVSLSGNFTYVDTTYSSLLPKQPLRVPKYSSSGVAQYQTEGLLRTDDQFTTAFVYQFLGDYNDLQTQPPYEIGNNGGYQLFNLTVSYKLGSGYVPHISDEEVFARIQNLFNRHYSQAFGFPSPTTNFEAGMKIGIAP
jgi:vitamin B12 transporter